MSITNDILKSLDEEMKKSITGQYVIEIGVFSGNKDRKEEKETVSLNGLNNAELMFIHENGSPLRNIPARPVLQMTIDWAKENIIPQTVDECIKNVLEGKWEQKDVEKELNIMCQRIQQYARDIIYLNDGRLIKNAPSTEKAKGFNHPLFQTSQLARSIRCKLIKLN